MAYVNVRGRLSSYPHIISHVEFLLIWSVMVSKIISYWVHSGGSLLLPEQWVYVSQTLDHSFQGWVEFCGFIFSLTCMLLYKQKLNVWLNAVAGLLWALMLFIPFPLERMSVALVLGVTAVARIMSKIKMAPKSKKSSKSVHEKMSEKSRSPVKSTNQQTVFNAVNNPTVPCDLDLSRLDIGSRGRKRETPKDRVVASLTPFAKPRPVLSPSRFSPSVISSPSQGNLTKASWVAGGYWHQNSGWGSPTSYTSLSSPNDSQTTLTRSSSQSSGFGSSFQTGLFNRSPPDSRPESMLEEIDRLSVFSDNLAETRSFNEVASVRTRYQDNSPVPYTYVHNNLSQVSALSSVSSANADGSHFVSSPFSSATLSQWSWLLPFLFGFSLALNICLIYLVFSTSTKN